MQKNQSIDFTSDLSEAMNAVTVNAEKGVIEGVVILTGEKVSKNKTFYTKKALQEAVTRYEGAKMFLDHPKSGEDTRSIRDFGGTYRNVRIVEGRFLKADLHLLPNKEIRDIVVPIAEAKPAGVGLSIRDRGHGQQKDGVFLVEGFAPRGQYSIDLVTEASVNETLFESNQGRDDEMEKEQLAKVSLDELLAANPALVESIRSTERQAANTELEESIKAGKEAPAILAKAKKLMALAESGLPLNVVEKIKPLIEGEAVTPEACDAMIKTQKEILEAMKAAPGAAGREPLVKGHGAGKETITEVSEGELPSDDDFARAIIG